MRDIFTSERFCCCFMTENIFFLLLQLFFVVVVIALHMHSLPTSPQLHAAVAVAHETVISICNKFEPHKSILNWILIILEFIECDRGVNYLFAIFCLSSFPHFFFDRFRWCSVIARWDCNWIDFVVFVSVRK